MERIKLHDKYFRPFISSEKISHAIGEVAKKLNNDYKEREAPLFLAVLNGSFMFAAHLLERLDFTCEISFIKLSSYSGTSSTGAVKEVLGLVSPVKGREVIVIEDIVDTGLTLQHFLTKIEAHNPADVKIAACLVKPMAFKADYIVDFSCFSIPNDFVVGYGLDYDGLGRNSSDIYKLAE